MPLIRLDDLFNVMKDILSSKYGFKPSQIKTKIIGTRPGEKLIEYLLTQFEMENVLETKDFFIIPSLNVSLKNSKYQNAKKPKNTTSYFKDMKILSKKEIHSILKKIY
jgi:FlaA1/EpsC-like NDP-sugar epimerase